MPSTCRRADAAVRLLLCLLLALLAARPAAATVPFSYQWKTPSVTVNWSEDNVAPSLTAGRRQVAHWKRVAEALWRQHPQAPALTMDVSLHGYFEYVEPGVSQGPIVRAQAGGRKEIVTAPLTDERIIQALLKVRGGPSTPAPADDAEPRISPDGNWTAFLTWRSGGPEVWVVDRSGSRVLRASPPATELREALLWSEPRWSADSKRVAWVQGGRLAVLEIGGAARFVTPDSKEVVDFLWSPHAASPLAVRYDDDTADLVDVRKDQSVSISDLVKGEAPIGDLSWSPSGTRLAFRTQSRIQTTGIEARWSELIDRVRGQNTALKNAMGSDVQRLAVLNLAEGRLDAYPLQGTPAETAEFQSTLWSPQEDALYATVGTGIANWHAVRIPLAHGQTPATLLGPTSPVHLLGWDTQNRLRLYVPGEVRYLSPGSTSPQAYPRAEWRHLHVRAGPQGGYLGVEADAVTENEPDVDLVLESASHTGGQPGTARFRNGLLVLVPQDDVSSAASAARDWPIPVVDADVHAAASGSYVVYMEADGAGKLVAVPSLFVAERIPLSERLASLRPEVVPIGGQAVAAVPASRGLPDLGDEQPRPDLTPVLLALVGLVVLVILGILLMRRRWK